MLVVVIDTRSVAQALNVSMHWPGSSKMLDTTVSGVQSAVRHRGARVRRRSSSSAARSADLFGRRARVRRGPCVFYAVGALAMVFAQSLTAVIVFWAILGGLGASLYLPAMQSLIHGNFDGKTRAKVSARSVRPGRSPRRSVPLIGGFVTTRAVVAGRVPDRGAHHRGSCFWGAEASATCRTPETGRSTYTGASLSVIGMGGLVLGVLALARGRRVRRPAARDRCGCDGRPGVLAHPRASARACPRCSIRPCLRPACSGTASPRSCSSRSRWAGS